jgi:spore coat protein CotH
MMVILVPIASADAGMNNNHLTGNNSTSHDSEALPDYDIVFPDAEIREIYITISSESWDAMQDDMVSKHGEFGSRNMSTPGGMDGPGGDMSFGNRTPGEDQMRPDDDKGRGMMMQEDPIYVPATISCNGETWDHVGLRYKGVNSLTTAWGMGIGKISLKVDLDHYEDEFPETLNQKFYGFKELNLQSGMSDKSVIREKIVPEIFQEAGVPAPETAFYKVYFDHGQGFEYFGLYTLVESVDDTVIETQFSNSSGNLYKPEGEGATFAEGKLNLDSFEKKTNEQDSDYSDIENLYNALHSDNRKNSPETWRLELESVFDVEGFITWLATNTLVKNWDTYGGNSRNYYIYNNPDTKIFSWIPWDNNYALMEDMGGKPGEGGPEGMNISQHFQINTPPEGFNMTMPGMDKDHGPGMGPDGMNSVTFSMENVTEKWPLIRYLMDDSVYHQEYLETLKEVAERSFNTTNLEEKFDKYHDLIESSVIGPDGEHEEYTYLTDASDFDNAFDEMKNHIRSQYSKAMEYLRSEGVA